MVHLRTARLILREPLKEDSIVLGSLWQNEMVRRYSHSPKKEPFMPTDAQLKAITQVGYQASAANGY